MRRTTAWFSHNLGMEMPLVAYGHAGIPLLMFPTAAADYLEYERFLLVDVIQPFIEQGLLRAYSINSVNRYSLLNDKASPQWKAELLSRYDHYIMEEVLPLIRNECGATAQAADHRRQPGSVSRGKLLLQASGRISRHDCHERQLRHPFVSLRLLRYQRLFQ